MSLINRMLQDLEQRHGHGGERRFPAGVHAVATQAGDGRTAWLKVALLVMLGITAMLLWLLLRPQPQTQPAPQPAPKPAPAAVQPQPVPAPAPQAEPVAPPVPVAQSQPLPPPPATDHSLPQTRESQPPPAPEKVRLKPAESLAARKAESDAGRKDQGATPKVSGKEAPLPIKQISPKQQAEYAYQNAVSLLQQGRLAEAQEGLEGVLRAAPDHAAARQVLVGILLERRQLAQAENLLREGLAQGAAQPEFAMALARIQVERGNGAGALETLEKYLAAGKDLAAYQSFLATLQQRQGQHKLAIEHFSAALRLSPAAPTTLVGLGISLQAENRLAEAQEAYARARSSGGLSPELQSFVDQRLKQMQQQLR